jgi:hypothetical protein
MFSVASSLREGGRDDQIVPEADPEMRAAVLLHERRRPLGCLLADLEPFVVVTGRLPGSPS